MRVEKPEPVPEPAEPLELGDAHPTVTARADRVFARQRRVDDFAFGKEVVDVFDDMVSRSVPGYREIERMTGELVADFAKPGTTVYDLGCSTGETLLAAQPFLPADFDVRFVGVDSSRDMLAEADAKLKEAGFPFPYALQPADLAGDLLIENASVVTLVLVLQFIRPLHRDALLKRIYDGLGDQGAVILVEKVLGENSTFNRQFIKHYYEFKRRNGYSELEISQKREALENVLIPYRLEEDKDLLRRAGFKEIDVFFKWYNFCGIVAMK